MQASAVSGSARSSPSLRAISAIDRNMMTVEIGSSMGRAASPTLPPTAPDAVAMTLCSRRDPPRGLFLMLRSATASAALSPLVVATAIACAAPAGSACRIRSIGLPTMLPRRAARPGCSSTSTAALSVSRSSSVMQTCNSGTGAPSWSADINALDRDRLLDPALGAEYPKVALDLARRAGRLVGVVGQFHRRAAIRLRHLADQRDGLERIVALGGAALEIVGQVGSPAEAHPHPAGKMPIGRFDRIDVEGVRENQELVLGIAALRLPPRHDLLAGFDRGRRIRAKAAPVGNPVRRAAQERRRAERVGQDDQQVAAVVPLPVLQHAIRHLLQFSVAAGERAEHHRQLVPVGADGSQIVLHRKQDVAGADEGSPEAFLQRLHAPALPEKAVPAPRAEVREPQVRQPREPLDLAPELGLGARIAARARNSLRMASAGISHMVVWVQGP